MCIRHRCGGIARSHRPGPPIATSVAATDAWMAAAGRATSFGAPVDPEAVSYTHLRAHETVLDIVCRLLLEKKKKRKTKNKKKKKKEKEAKAYGSGRHSQLTIRMEGRRETNDSTESDCSTTYDQIRPRQT